MCLTLHQVAKQLQVHWSTVRAAANSGELVVVKLGKSAKSWRVDPADLADYIQRMKTCPSEKPKRETTLSRSTLDLDRVLAEGRQHLKMQDVLNKRSVPFPVASPEDWKKLLPNT